MIGRIKLIALAITHLLFAIIVLTGFYYLKYRPVRNKCQKTAAANIELRKQIGKQDTIISVVWERYYRLASQPRYQIDQHLDRIKIKRGSTLEFVPNAIMQVQDSLQFNLSDSIKLQIPIVDTLNEKYRSHWWQFWRKKRQPP